MKKIDYPLLLAILLLLVIGLFSLSSSGVFVSCQKFNDCSFYLKHQILFGLIPGLVLFIFFSFFNYKFLKKFAYFFYIISLFLLISVFIPGIRENIKEVYRWITIFNISFQPSEFVKLFLLIFVSAFLANREKHITSFKKVFIPFSLFLIPICLLLIRQPDIGTLLIILFPILSIYLIAGGRIKFLLFSGILAIPFGLLVIGKINHVIERVVAFFSWNSDVSEKTYHIKQAVLAISSGGFWGQGIGHATSKFKYLPEQISDSIFAVMAEEFGFLVISFIVLIYLFVVYRIFYISSLSKNSFGLFLSAGIGLLFAFQAFINMGAMLGIAILTGTPLPLVGYGGTNMVVFLMAFGIVINISRKTTK